MRGPCPDCGEKLFANSNKAVCRSCGLKRYAKPVFPIERKRGSTRIKDPSALGVIDYPHRISPSKLRLHDLQLGHNIRLIVRKSRRRIVSNRIA
jgi:hypothetical protein